MLEMSIERANKPSIRTMRGNNVTRVQKTIRNTLLILPKPVYAYTCKPPLKKILMQNRL